MQKWTLIIITTIFYLCFGTTSLKAEMQIFAPDATPRTQSVIDQPYGFQGGHRDKESGFIYKRARYYSPKQGRFISRDAMGYIDSKNLYQYVKSNPIKYTDPSGYKTLEVKTPTMEKRKWPRGTFSALGKATYNVTLDIDIEVDDKSCCCYYKIKKAVLKIHAAVNLRGNPAPDETEAHELGHVKDYIVNSEKLEYNITENWNKNYKTKFSVCKNGKRTTGAVKKKYRFNTAYIMNTHGIYGEHAMDGDKIMREEDGSTTNNAEESWEVYKAGVENAKVKDWAKEQMGGLTYVKGKYVKYNENVTVNMPAEKCPYEPKGK